MPTWSRSTDGLVTNIDGRIRISHKDRPARNRYLRLPHPNSKKCPSYCWSCGCGGGISVIRRTTKFSIHWKSWALSKLLASSHRGLEGRESGVPSLPGSLKNERSTSSRCLTANATAKTVLAGWGGVPQIVFRDPLCFACRKRSILTEFTKLMLSP